MQTSDVTESGCFFTAVFKAEAAQNRISTKGVSFTRKVGGLLTVIGYNL